MNYKVGTLVEFWKDDYWIVHSVESRNVVFQKYGAHFGTSNVDVHKFKLITDIFTEQ